jgi:methionyl-tRNA formyltransferase
MSPADDTRRRLLLLGDGLWAAAALRHLTLHHDVLAVVERLRPTDDSLADAARTAKLPLHRWEDVNAPATREWIHSLAPELLLSVSYDQIFGPALLGPAALPVLNLHAGHPERQRGRAILCWQLLEGARAVDVTVMRVTRGIDRGPLLALARVELAETDDYGAAMARICSALPALLDEALGALTHGRTLPKDPAAWPVYYPRRFPGDEWLDWACDSTTLLRKIRALAAPNCLARTRVGERDLWVARAEPCPDFPVASGIPGALIGRDPIKGLLVTCGAGALWLTELRGDDGRALPLKDFHLSDRFGAETLPELESLRRRVGELESRLARLEEVAHVC